jgi:hypothetical protein
MSSSREKRPTKTKVSLSSLVPLLRHLTLFSLCSLDSVLFQASSRAACVCQIKRSSCSLASSPLCRDRNLPLFVRVAAVLYIPCAPSRTVLLVAYLFCVVCNSTSHTAVSRLQFQSLVNDI